MDDLDRHALAALIERNRALAADLGMVKRIVAVLLAQAALARPDPAAHVFETVERLRAALHVSDDPARRAEWEDMERCLDDVARIAASLIPPSRPS